MVRALKDSIGKLDAAHSGSDTTRRVSCVDDATGWRRCDVYMLMLLCLASGLGLSSCHVTLPLSLHRHAGTVSLKLIHIDTIGLDWDLGNRRHLKDIDADQATAIWGWRYVPSILYSWTLQTEYLTHCYARLSENDPQPELVAQLAQEMYSNDMLQAMVSNMWRFEFEVRAHGNVSHPLFTISAGNTGMLSHNPLLPLTLLRLLVHSQARKDVAQIFNHLLRRQIGSRLPTVEYLSSKPDVVLSALKG